MTYHPRITSPDEVQRPFHHMPAVARFAENSWASGFARSVSGQSWRRGWKQSKKQRSFMRALVSDLFIRDLGRDQEGSFQLIE